MKRNGSEIFIYISINNKQHDDYRQYFQKNVPSPNNSFTSMVVVVLMVIFSPTKACPNPPSELDDAVMIGIIINIVNISSSSSSIHYSYVFFGWVWNVLWNAIAVDQYIFPLSLSLFLPGSTSVFDSITTLFNVSTSRKSVEM